MKFSENADVVPHVRLGVEKQDQFDLWVVFGLVWRINHHEQRGLACLLHQTSLVALQRLMSAKACRTVLLLSKIQETPYIAWLFPGVRTRIWISSDAWILLCCPRETGHDTSARLVEERLRYVYFQKQMRDKCGTSCCGLWRYIKPPHFLVAISLQYFNAASRESHLETFDKNSDVCVFIFSASSRNLQNRTGQIHACRLFVRDSTQNASTSVHLFKIKVDMGLWALFRSKTSTNCTHGKARAELKCYVSR
jgi:hypothetical protein